MQSSVKRSRSAVTDAEAALEEAKAALRRSQAEFKVYLWEAKKKKSSKGSDSK